MKRAWPILLRPKIMGWANRWRRSGKGALFKPLILSSLAVGFWILSFMVFQKVLVYFRSVELFGDLLASKLMAMLLLTFFSFLLFSNIISSLSTFFLAEDLPLVLSCPVALDRLYYSRLAETAVHSSWMVLFFGLPVFFVYGWVYRSSLDYYLVLIGTLIPFLIIPAALGAMFSMVLVNTFPARRTREVLFLLSISLVIGLYFLLRFLQPERLVNPDSFAGLVEYFTALNTPTWPFLPSFWAAESLTPFYQGGPSSGGFFFALLWSTAAGMVVVGNWLFRALYFEGWNRSQEARRARFTRSRFVNLLFQGLSGPLDPGLKALTTKELKYFFRDTTQWSQLILLLALVVVYLYNFSVLPLDKSPLPTFYLQNLLAFLNTGLAGFVLSAVAGRFVYPAVSLEGSAFWVIRSAPVSLRNFLRSKFWMYLFPLLLLAETLIFLSNYFLKVSSFMMILSALTIFFMTFGIVSLAVGMGAVYPRFRVENAAQIASGFGGVLYMILSLIFIGGIVLLEAWPVYTLFMAKLHPRPLSLGEWTAIVFSFTGVVGLMGVAVIVPMRVGLRRIAAIDF